MIILSISLNYILIKMVEMEDHETLIKHDTIDLIKSSQ